MRTYLGLFALFAVSIHASAARAVDSENVLTGYSLASWTEGDGRLLTAVYAIAQDVEGFLWIGTDTGLIRFDGWRFARWETLSKASLPRGPIMALCAARDGGLWIGFADGTVRQVMHGQVQEGRSLTGGTGPVENLAEDHNGAVWAVITGKLHRFRGGRWETVILDLPSPAGFVIGARTISNNLWVATTVGLYKWNESRDAFQKVLSRGTSDVAEDESHRLWVPDEKQGFRLRDESNQRSSAFQANGYRLLYDQRGNLWVGTIGQGLWRVHITEGGSPRVIEKASLHSGLLGNSAESAVVESIIQDRDANIWVGTTGGLYRLTERTFMPVATAGPVMSLESGQGAIWAGTGNGLLRLSPSNQQWPRQPVQPANLWVRSLHRDNRSVLWVGTAHGLYRVVHSRFERVSPVPGTRQGAITTITSDPTGHLWFSDGTHLFEWKRSRLVSIERPAPARNGIITRLYADSVGRLWIVLSDGKLCVLDSDTGKLRSGLGVEGIRQTTYDIFEDQDRIVWILGSGGLMRFAKGRFVTLTQERGFPLSEHGAVITDEKGNLWLNIDVGLIRFERKDLTKAFEDQASRLQYKFYDTSDGVAGPPIVSVLAKSSADGTLWFVRGGVLTSVNPRRLGDASTLTLGAVRIENAVIDDDKMNYMPRGVLPSGTRRIEINYTALALTAPQKVHFRYRLEGFDAAWIDAGTGRQAFYTNLPPRTYRFIVEAANNANIWNGSEASWTFRIQPTFYQSNAFYSLCAVFLCLMAAGIWKLRVNMMHREFSAVLAERLRLSREIHDTLLQNLVGLALQFDALPDRLGTPSLEARHHLVRVRKQIEDHVREARQSIYELRSLSPLRRDLEAALREFGTRALAGTSVRFDLTTNGQPGTCSAKLTNVLFRIGQEAITNAVRHAQSERICIDLQFDAEAVTLRVVDNGRGFDIAQVQNESNDHYGLVCMRERAEDIGAQFDLSSEKGRGTVVRVVAWLLQD
jgi:signal transduction histidine kinase/ligand-binding sensor domain-containing protein